MSFRSTEARNTSTLASTSNPLEPIIPPTEASAWLHEYFRREPAYVVGDDLATCFHSCGAVILTALVLGTDSSASLADLTSYPPPFIAAVISQMQAKELWSAAQVAALMKTLRETPNDWQCLKDDLNDVTEQFWDVVWTPEAQIALESLRQRVLFGGEAQRWMDKDAAEFFEL
jgi:hypothetical protein